MVAYTPNKGLPLPTVAGDTNLWGTFLNQGQTLIDNALGANTTIAVGGSANVTVTALAAQNLMQVLTGTLTGNIDYLLPATGGMFVVDNKTAGNFLITAKTVAGGSTGFVVPQGQATPILSNGTNVTPFFGTAAGGLLIGPGDFQQVEVLPTVSKGTSGLPTTLLARRVGSDATVGSGGNLWVMQTSWVQTNTTAPAGVRMNFLAATSAGAGVDPGETWAQTSLLSTYASEDSLNAVAVYGQGLRRGLPGGGKVGVPILAGVLETRSLSGKASSTDGYLRGLEIDIICNGPDDISVGPGREALTVVIEQELTSGGTVPHVDSVIGIYSTTGATIGTGYRANSVTWTEALFDGRGGNQGGSAHTFWMKTNQSIGLDNAGGAGAANTKISSDGTTVAVVGKMSASAPGAAGNEVVNYSQFAQVNGNPGYISLPGGYRRAFGTSSVVLVANQATINFGTTITTVRKITVSNGSAPTSQEYCTLLGNNSIQLIVFVPNLAAGNYVVSWDVEGWA